ncbi:hypothetical protein LT337_32535 (plasmid) [Mycolicibacterium fortuitum]|nr:hypothetical protein LT337_32535 [Mycolicibacterium fortuitum]
MPSNTPTVDELIAEGVPRNVAVLIQPHLNRWASEVGDLSRAIRQATAT